MKKLLTSVLLFVLVLSSTGCASYLSYKSSEREILGQRVAASGDEAAIKAFASGNTVGIGVNVLATESLTKHPLRQLGAALLDVGVLAGLVAGVDSISSSSSTTININGDNNTYQQTTGSTGSQQTRDNNQDNSSTQ